MLLSLPVASKETFFPEKMRPFLQLPPGQRFYRGLRKFSGAVALSRTLVGSPLSHCEVEKRYSLASSYIQKVNLQSTVHLTPLVGM